MIGSRAQIKAEVIQSEKIVREDLTTSSLPSGGSIEDIITLFDLS